MALPPNFTPILEKLLRKELANVPDIVTSTYPSPLVESTLRSSIEETLKSLEWEEYGEYRYRNSERPDKKLEDFLPHLVQTPGGEYLLTRLRFMRSGDALIELHFSSIGIHEPGALEEIWETCRRHYENFHPVELNYHDFTGAPPFPNAEVDFHYIAGDIARIDYSPWEEDLAKVRLIPMRPEEVFERYQQYLEPRNFTEFTPHNGIHDVSWQESTNVFYEQGLFNAVFAGDEFLGIMAGYLAPDRCLIGYRTVQEVLRKDRRGLGLGRAMQRSFIRSLDPERGRLIYGYIVPTNQPSLHTALSCGREIIGTSYFLPMPH